MSRHPETAPPEALEPLAARELRSDARDNRERILQVARTTFAEQGIDVPMRELARRAGVGPATLYRRFPTKEALVTEAFGEQMATCAAIVDEGLADPDPWHGLRTVIERVCVMHALDRGFTAAFVTAFPDAVDFAQERTRALRSLAELIQRAKDGGGLRRDVGLDDLIMVIMANSGIRASSPKAAVAASRRFAALQIQALQAQPSGTSAGTRAGTGANTAPLPPAVRLPLLKAI
ncbi:TetR/AcrR family transcriptional regulator [Promicromonospora sukumoe]|uniref:AcrR family transcriptional regulator n=1 Tax=Promicromonospora sukumoe TaxID=88382 RepID=A0A7W3J8M5_9MICO|nr:TetR/AcrR family transcriptional regulator [Promicromonospora sukumoe]MBA8808204.1 AcrR family transcriptional regulator [Promicromonospora sukumoe]